VAVTFKSKEFTAKLTSTFSAGHLANDDSRVKSQPVSGSWQNVGMV